MDLRRSRVVRARVVGRWVGTRKVHVDCEDGRARTVASTAIDADEVDVDEPVVVLLDAEGHGVDWWPAAELRRSLGA